METVKVAAIQMNCIADDKKSSINKAISMLYKGIEMGAKLLALPELFYLDYYQLRKRDQNIFKLAEPIPGQTTDVFSEIAKSNNIYIVCPIFEKTSRARAKIRPFFKSKSNHILIII